MRRSLAILLLAPLLVGCATTRHVSNLPADAFVTHRATLNAPGRQFTLNGYLSLSATGGKRLVIAENFGGVAADVLVKPDGKIYVMKSSPIFRADWIRNYIAPDLNCAFGGAAGRISAPDKNHLILKRLGYSLDLHILDVRPGPQDAKLFDETGAEKP